MKKLLICLLFVNFVTFLSSASPDGLEISSTVVDVLPADSVDNSPEEQEITDIEEDLFQEPMDQTMDQSPLEKKQSEEKDILSKYPVPGEIEEPDIITLEPEQGEAKEELVETELPPLNFDNTEEKAEEKTEKNIADQEVSKTKIPTETEFSEENEEGTPEEDKTVIENTEPAEKEIENQTDVKDSEKIEEKTETVTEEVPEPVIEIIKPSRSVTLKRREYVDITYPGTGWIYIGIVDGSKDLSYFGRDIGTKDTTFTLQAQIPGTKVLHFCKNDYLTGEYIDDYIEIIILPEEGSNKTHIDAPEYKQPLPVPVSVPEKLPEQKEDNAQAENIKTDIQDSEVPKVQENVNAKNEKVENNGNTEKATTITATEKDIPLDITSQEQTNEAMKKTSEKQESDFITIPDDDEIEFSDFAEEGISIPEEEVVETSKNSDTTDCNTLLKEADFLYNEKEFKAAYEKVNLYLQYATTNIDEGLLLKGKILEARSELQDIKGAIEVYNTLMKDYPASIHWDEANKRIIYLKRFYLEVR